MNRSQYDKRIESFKHYGTSSIGDDRHDAEYDTETMEKGNGKAYPIVFGEFHALPYAISVVRDIVVSKHYSFWEACSPRSILHIHYIITVEFLFLGF